MTEQKTISISPIDRVTERVTALEADVQLLKMIVNEGRSATEAEVRQETRKVIQINTREGKFFCTTSQEQQAFKENNPGMAIESFNIELAAATADKYLNDPANKKRFTVPEPVRN